MITYDWNAACKAVSKKLSATFLPSLFFLFFAFCVLPTSIVLLQSLPAHFQKTEQMTARKQFLGVVFATLNRKYSSLWCSEREEERRSSVIGTLKVAKPNEGTIDQIDCINLALETLEPGLALSLRRGRLLWDRQS